MKVVSLSLLLIFLSAPADQDVFNSLRNLEGTWKMDTPRGRLFERWAVVGDHELKGTSFKVSNSDTIILENIQSSISIQIKFNRNIKRAVSIFK